MLDSFIIHKYVTFLCFWNKGYMVMAYLSFYVTAGFHFQLFNFPIKSQTGRMDFKNDPTI
jgi:hypothetical protein